MNGAQPGAFLPIAVMMFAAGIGIPVFAAFNAGLGKQLGGPVIATAARICSRADYRFIVGSPHRFPEA